MADLKTDGGGGVGGIECQQGELTILLTFIIIAMMDPRILDPSSGPSFGHFSPSLIFRDAR
jgi:hypothetical protein